jgi:hypothetical protein
MEWLHLERLTLRPLRRVQSLRPYAVGSIPLGHEIEKISIRRPPGGGVDGVRAVGHDLPLGARELKSMYCSSIVSRGYFSHFGRVRESIRLGRLPEHTGIWHRGIHTNDENAA